MKRSSCLNLCKKAGFTLIEVLVALAIVAIALAAGTRAVTALIHNSERSVDIVLAQWCAENALIDVKLHLFNQLPSIGEESQSCTQGDRTFQVNVVTSATMNPSLRRVDANVSTQQYFVLSLSTLIGRY